MIKIIKYLSIIILAILGLAIGYYIVAGFFMSIISLCTFSNHFLKEIFFPFSSTELLHIFFIRFISYIGAIIGCIIGTAFGIGIVEDL